MLYSPAIKLLPVYFFTQTFLGNTQQETLEYTDDIAEELSTRLVLKTLGEFFKPLFIFKRDRWDP